MFQICLLVHLTEVDGFKDFVILLNVFVYLQFHWSSWGCLPAWAEPGSALATPASSSSFQHTVACVFMVSFLTRSCFLYSPPMASSSTHTPDQLYDGGGEGEAHQDVHGHHHHVQALVWVNILFFVFWKLKFKQVHANSLVI